MTYETSARRSSCFKTFLEHQLPTMDQTTDAKVLDDVGWRTGVGAVPGGGALTDNP